MARIIRPTSLCPIHGKPTKRSECRSCNAAYMREYLWHRRQQEPDRELWRRARKRAADRGVPFDLPLEDVFIPPACPVLGVPLEIGGPRSPNSPSLDRIVPALGYVTGNVRVISDLANRFKGAKSLGQLKKLTARSEGDRKVIFQSITEYVEREALLAAVRNKASSRKAGAQEWAKIAAFLEKVFSRGQLLS